MPGSGSIGRFFVAVLHIVAAVLHHSRCGEQGQVTIAGSLKTVGDKIVAGSICQRVVAVGLIADTAGDEVIALLGVGDGAAAGTTALDSSGADGNSCAGNLNIGIVVAVETLLWTSLRGIGKDGTIAYGDGSCTTGIAVNGIVAIAVADGDTTIEIDIATTSSATTTVSTVVAISISMAVSLSATVMATMPLIAMPVEQEPSQLAMVPSSLIRPDRKSVV